MSHREIITSAPIHLSDTQRQAAIAAVASGLKQTTVAKQFGIHPNTLCRWMKEVKKVVDSGLPQDWRSTMRTKAIEAVGDGLTCRDDAYKRGELGNKTLVGLGEFKSDAGTVNVFVNQVVNLPADWQSEYLSVESTPVVNVTASELPASIDPHE